jgi:hypothetical protein
MLSETPTVHQRAPVASADSISTRVTAAVAAIQDADLEIDQLDVGDLGLVFAEILAQRDVERVDRAVDRFGHRHALVSPSIEHLHHRLGHRLQLAVGVEAALDHDSGSFDAKKSGTGAQHAPGEQFEARVGALIGVAGRLALLDYRDQPVEPDRPWRPECRAASSSLKKFDLPPWSDTITLPVLPTVSGGTCS